FAAQMINFTIPGTGSSGHLGGGLILAIILGPHAAFLTIASVLIIQALFFADGGLLALGCNIFNLGIFPCFIAYPFIYQKIVGKNLSAGTLTAASVLAAIAGLQMGAFGVVLETVFSGISSLPFSSFVVMMQPIHLGIGIVEGLVTAGVAAFIWKARPEILEAKGESRLIGDLPLKQVLAGLVAATVITGGVVAWFASEHPDGLEWSIMKVTGSEEVEGTEGGVHHTLAAVQESTAFLPDYGLPAGETEETAPAAHEGAAAEESTWGQANIGTSISGLVGGLLTLLLAGAFGYLLKNKKEKFA
ncbi:MAG: energy-coupling factor ABC transporter permease, partial [Desulfobulbaceae bacterium]|nr:energy-coupling factor ABC transporter permease [Desulfobulbaceae bacterium]